MTDLFFLADERIYVGELKKNVYLCNVKPRGLHGPDKQQKSVKQQTN